MVRKVEANLYDAQPCSGNRVLVTERSLGRVRLLDVATGRELRSVEGLNSPTDAELLDNGNVLVLHGIGKVTEHDPQGRVIRTFEGLNNPFDVDRLINGNTLVADSGNNRLVELDLDGKIVWEQRELAFPNNVFRLQNGNTLFTTYTTGSVVMLAPDGKEVWSKQIVRGTLYSVYCGGNEIYVSDAGNGKVWILDMDGREIRKVDLQFSFRSTSCSKTSRRQLDNDWRE